MSAINEWFGYYNSIFAYIQRTYGQEELERYFDYLVNTPYSDVVESFRNGGLDAIRTRYTKNFIKDGDEHTVQAEQEGDTLTMHVRCPAYFNAPPVSSEDRQIGPFFCACCERLETGVLQAAGYELKIDRQDPAHCLWTIQKRA